MGHRDEAADKIDYLKRSLVDIVDPADNFVQHFDYLRWLQGFNYDVKKASAAFRRSLEFRRVSPHARPGASRNKLALDDHEFTFLGTASKSKDGYLLMYERYFPHPGVNALDIFKDGRGYGIMDYLQNRLFGTDQCLKMIHQVENQTKKQSGLYFVIDLQAMDFTPTGLMELVRSSFNDYVAFYETYIVEIVKKIVVINAPSMLLKMWNIISKILPGSFIGKVRVLADKEQILDDFEIRDLPDFLGGELSIENIDPVHGAFFGPENPSYTPPMSAKEISKLTQDHVKFSLSKGQTLYAKLRLNHCKAPKKVKITWNFVTDRSCDFGAFHSDIDDVIAAEGNYRNWVVPCYRPLIACDHKPEIGHVEVDKPGFYFVTFKFHGWILQKMHVVVKIELNSGGKAVEAEYSVV